MKGSVRQEIKSIEDSILQLQKETRRRYLEVQDFAVSFEKTESFIKWKKVTDSEILSLKNKRKRLCQKLN